MGGGVGACRKTDNVFVARKDGMFIRSEKSFNYMYLCQQFGPNFSPLMLRFLIAVKQMPQ